MSVCTGSPAEENMERYLKGTLPELQARSFEEHFFECPTCLAHLEALEAVTVKLATAPAAKPRQLRPKTPVLWPYYIAEAIAAMVVLGLLAMGGLRLMRRESGAAAATRHRELASILKPPTATTSALALLADTSLPPFEMSHLRGAGGNPAFAAGMQAYARHDCPGALPLLSQVARDDADYLSARLYTGLCQGQLKQWVSATDTLKGVAYKGDSPQQEAAFYYLAQAEMSRDNAANAEQDLVRTIVLHGDFEHRATAELTRLRSTPIR